MSPTHYALLALSAALVLLSGSVLNAERRRRGRARQRGGYIRPRPSASSLVSRVAPYTTGGIPARGGNGSSSSAHGNQSMGAATRPTRLSANRTTALGFSGSATAGGRGRVTTVADGDELLRRQLDFVTRKLA